MSVLYTSSTSNNNVTKGEIRNAAKRTKSKDKYINWNMDNKGTPKRVIH
jgi:hypothetical protein